MSEQTRQRLDAHHGGAQFHDVMLRSFEARFGEAFGSFWDEHVAPHHGDAPTYLDLGSGPGLMLRRWRDRWPNAKLHGVELQPYMLDTAKDVAQQATATLHEADLHTLRLPLPDRSVDAILCAMVIHEMREPIGMLREARRLLAPHGRLMIMDWVRVPLARYLARWDDDPLQDDAEPESRAERIDHFMEHNKFSRDDLLWLVERCGLTVQTTLDRNDGQFLWLVASAARP